MTADRTVESDSGLGSGGDAASLLAGALALGSSHSPFPWQTRLLKTFAEGVIPRSLDIPTGLGKTSTIAIWLVARALGADVPRRIVYIVDRRVVVDQATEVAVGLRKWVDENERIQEGLGLGGRPLPISTLRGQFVDNREWLEDPACPAIVVGTVDMVGSRLLFEGYGVSRKMRPFHAGVLGCDNLFVLDEAHLVPPFERLLERVALDRDDLGPASETSLLVPPVPRLLSLSATGRSRGGHPFELDDESDSRNEEIQRRLDAPKRATVESLCTGDELSDVLVERAWTLAGRGVRSIRCIVFTDTRTDAEAVCSALLRLAGKYDKKKSQVRAADVELLVGGRRQFERAEAAIQLRRLGFLAGSEGPPERPAFLVATSAGEVGVDLDADHLVCDLVPWERMIQRLGRVNRRGGGDARVAIIGAQGPGREDGLEAVRALIERLPALDDGTRDASPGLSLIHISEPTRPY